MEPKYLHWFRIPALVWKFEFAFLMSSLAKFNKMLIIYSNSFKLWFKITRTNTKRWISEQNLTSWEQTNCYIFDFTQKKHHLYHSLIYFFSNTLLFLCEEKLSTFARDNWTILIKATYLEEYVMYNKLMIKCFCLLSPVFSRATTNWPRAMLSIWFSSSLRNTWKKGRITTPIS